MSDQDPMAELEALARRQDAEEKAAKAFSHARARLVLGKDASHAFFASLALKLEPVADWSVDTAYTDGRVLGYNPEWLAKLPPEQAKAIVIHEVLHLANKHHARRGSRNPAKANIAMDLSINPLLRDAGFQVPPYGLFPGEGKYKDLPAGKSFEAYYDLLPDDPPQDGGGQQGDDPGGMGGVRDPGDGSESACRQAEAEAAEAVAAAAEAAKGRGQLPGGLGRMVEQTLKPKVDWRETLREFVTRHARSDYSWARPNRRFIASGICLPGMFSEELGEVVCAVDTSGSIGPQQLSRFAGEMQGILEAFAGCKLTIVFHDSDVAGVQHWSPEDGPLVLEPKGGGGTDHRPVFDWLDQQGEAPTCLVCLTDLMTCFPERAPDYPVLWAAVGAGSARPPFGQFVEVE